MDSIEGNKTRRLPSIHFIPEITPSDSIKLIPSNIREYLQKKREQQVIMTDISVSELIFLLERESPLNAISHQIHLSETIELITGTLVSDKIYRFRGLMLNFERAMIYFYLFHRIFELLKEFQMAKAALRGYSSFQRIFETLWDLKFPYGLIRPADITQPLLENKIPKIRHIFQYQVKIGWKIAKHIEKKIEINDALKKFDLFSPDDVKSIGLSGPIAQASGVLPVLNPITSTYPRKSAQHFIQYAQTSESNLWGSLRVGYVELILALNRTSLLLQAYPVSSQTISQETLNGEVTSSFLTTLGNSHLTINLSNGTVKYFNYISVQMANMAGITKLLSICPNELKSIILLFYNPEIQFS
ncbi:MAG: hypothetical protein JSV04_06735 [Candidatus Heimdallarchaeota archaeon]|nr:MAG: hypothetical protein JSV04_06735 [Candidatus Heimdallarchaeota archaeon]